MKKGTIQYGFIIFGIFVFISLLSTKYSLEEEVDDGKIQVQIYDGLDVL